MNAVHSEFYERQNDSAYILNQFRCHSSKQGHQYNKVFLIGNKESLRVEGEVGYDDLYDQVLEFYRSKYCGKVMKLVVLGVGRFLY
ncbi:uncharacterized protein LOC127086967 isoform X4 [Lathyrus oleraceus]|uniref:uncharacterized protein LOC127086967 isoform X1 n=1 Tax=Pisum sativum TaxID=3888 RepID=UPI001FC55C3E|nr:uncharacterized protein LOC127086967 isoform X1 [Pisum sativum]XP_050883748.1 uncharacterized protein LOC127086967 isoform X4 [Pisum sativum]XP_050883751.1 uncharacterized protein LOC127086967 isoform X4 [Pisum sativum]